MAGERLAIQRLFYIRPSDAVGSWTDVWIDGNYWRFTAVAGNANLLRRQYRLVDPDSLVTPKLAQEYTVDGVIFAVTELLQELSLAGAYTVRKTFGTGTDPAVLYGYNAHAGLVNGLVIEATTYNPRYDFKLPVYGGSTGFSWFNFLENTIRPVQVAVSTTPTGAFGTATGTITLVASNGNAGVYTYTWADPGAPLTAGRTGLSAGTYTCTVRDESGASTTVVVAVGTDSRLDVLVNRSDNNVTLVPSGGLPPYAFAWADGPTTATRLALGAGTFVCTVSDARGASRQVEVKVNPYRFYWSKNPVTLALDAGADYRLDPTLKPNLSFVCEVWVEEAYRSNVFVPVGGTQEQPADRAGRTVFDAQALLDSYLSEHLPAVSQAAPSRADSLFRRFYFRYAEKYGAEPVAAPLSNQAQHYVVFGGLDFFELPAATWFNSYQAGAKPFLTWEPNDKKCLPDQPEYLYFMPDSFALESFQVQVRVRYADGTAGELVAAVVENVHRYEVYCLPAGYQQLALGGGKAVAGWEVWVSDAAGVAQSERRRYQLDRNYVAKPRYFLYTNSLGGVSTLACTGRAKTALDVKSEEADRPLGAGYDPLLGDTLVLDKSGGPVLSVSSGPLRRAQLVALQDFLLAKRVTLQTDQVYFAGKVKAKSMPLADENPGELKALDFDFQLPRQRLFTPRLSVAPAGLAVAPVSGGEGAQP
ncbi:MAG TPA: hypothetical protein VF630_13295 [Hymenobacter sp.]